MPTKVSLRTFSKRANIDRTVLKNISRQNKKCSSLDSTLQSLKINNIFEKQKSLSDRNIILDIDGNSGAIETSYSILNSMGISVQEDIQHVDYSILGDAGLDSKKLEKMKKTQDSNPNRIQAKRFDNLKTTKIKSSDLFEKSTTNSIFELDKCIDEVRSFDRKIGTNIIKITNDMLDNQALRTIGY